MFFILRWLEIFINSIDSILILNSPLSQGRDTSNVNKQHLPTNLNIRYVINFLHFKQFILLWKQSHNNKIIGMLEERSRNILTALCLCRLHLLTSFYHICFNIQALTHSLNWASNQSSHSRRRFSMLNRTICHQREPDESQCVEHTNQTNPTDAHWWPTVGLVCPGLHIVGKSF